MKKITLALFFLIPIFGFSQSPIELIKDYANKNRSKFSLTTQDIADLVIVNEFNSESTGIYNYHVKQRVSGIEVYSSDSNFWIKNNQVINGGEDFIPNVAAKVNATVPSKTVAEALMGILSEINENQLTVTRIIESNNHDFKLSNGVLTEDPIRAELVYFQIDANTFRLAWDYEFYSQNVKHLWNLKVDAVTGKLLEKKDMVISCSFTSSHEAHNHGNHQNAEFAKKFFKSNTSALLTPGTTKYMVIPWNYESPNHSARQLVTNPEATTALAPLTLAASPNGWHNASPTIGASTTTYNYTRGNNVYAKDDTDSNNTGGVSPTASAGTYPNLTFDFLYPGTMVSADRYLPAATTNLFYMNNIMHDIWYQYGFNEANKNFQTANYSRGGMGLDAVNAEAQDGATLATPNLNNANFATPTDGSAPRMQMYLWDYGPQPTLKVNTPVSAAVVYTIRDNNFDAGHVNLPAPPSGVTANLVLFQDATPDETDACSVAVNGAALSGKIAVIRRGNCNFTEKVMFAQNAGALAAVIVNNVSTPIAMAGTNAAITIPAVSMSMADGEALIAAMAGNTLNATVAGPSAAFVNSDGDFDNGIIAHEYGHGISTRLSGNCLGGPEQQGEGWSDWFWLMMQIKPGDTRYDARGIGTFAAYQPTNGNGIRQYKYSTDMSVNPHTYASTNGMWYNNGTSNVVDSHSIGSVWCVMLWDLAWNFIDTYGYDPNIYSGTGGNNKVMRLILDAIKLDGCNPTFISARDAILAADQAANGGANYAMIWNTFAIRGLGYSANAGSATGVPAGISDQTEAYDLPPNLSNNSFEVVKSVSVYPNPTKGLLNVAVHNYSGKLTIQVFDLNGRKVYYQDVNDFNAERTVNLSNLQSGMYLIKVDGDNLNYTQKIILN